MVLIYCFQNVGGTSQVIRKTQLLDRLTLLHQFRSSVTMFANCLGNLTVLSKRSIWVKTSDMWRSLLANEFWLRISSVLPVTCSKKFFTSESSSSSISSAIFTICPSSRSNFSPRPRPPNWINECEDWMNKDGLNWMNMKIGSNELEIELNEYNNWIEWI